MNFEKLKTNPEWLPKYIGKYKILQIIGMGGMGVIYKALQESLNRIVALKVLPPQFCSNEEVAHRFEIEAKAISMLQHRTSSTSTNMGAKMECVISRCNSWMEKICPASSTRKKCYQSMK